MKSEPQVKQSACRMHGYGLRFVKITREQTGNMV